MTSKTKRKVNEIYQTEIVNKFEDKKLYEKDLKSLSEKQGKLERELNSLSGSSDFLMKRQVSKELEEVTDQLENLLNENSEVTSYKVHPKIVDEMSASYQEEMKPIIEAVDSEYNKLIDMLEDVAMQYQRVLAHQYKAVVVRTQFTTAKNLLTNPDKTTFPKYYSADNYTTPGTLENKQDIQSVVSKLKTRLQEVQYSDAYKKEGK